jgi:hypothetical protein
VAGHGKEIMNRSSTGSTMQPKKKKHTTPNQDAKHSFSLNSTKIHTSMEVIVIPHSFNGKLKIEFLTHFYFRKYEMKLKSGKKSHPL